MDNKNQSLPIDPVDLISEHYEPAEMRDAYRREILAKSRAIVAARRRSQMISWLNRLAGATAVAILIIMAWQVFQSSLTRDVVTPGHNFAQRHANVTPKIADGAKKSLTTAPPKVANQGGKSADPLKQKFIKPYMANVQHSTGNVIHTTTPKKQNQPIMVVVSLQQPVCDGSGRKLEVGDRLAVGTSISTGAEGRVVLVTKKGTEMHLDSNSKLTLSTTEIAAISRGRLYCNNRDKEIARIDTPAGHVRLLGTVVDTAVVCKDTVAVTVVEGKVRLSNLYGYALVNAGRRSMLVASRPPQSGVTVNTFKETSWYHGRGDFQSDFGDIAYTVGRNDFITEIWMMKQDGTNRRRIRSFIGTASEIGPWMLGERWLSVNLSSVLWTTPDIKARSAHSNFGHTIVNGQMVLLDAATGTSIPINLPPDFSPFYRSFAPESNLLAFNGSRRPYTSDVTNVECGVWVYDRTTGKATMVLEGDIKTAPAWSPDSRHIAISSGQEYTNDHNLVIIDVETGQAQNLGVNGAGACFSPDGSKIAYCADFKQRGSWYSGVPMSGSIFVLDLAPGAQPIRISPANEWATRPRWSPDGKRVIYIRSENGLCIANADGTGWKQLQEFDGNIQRASWASAGDAIYVTVGERESYKTRTLLVAADGSGIIKTLSQPDADSRLCAKAQRQSDAAAAAIKEAVFLYAMGEIYSYDANLETRRQSYAKAADIFAQLIWNYPESGLGTDDVLRYADAAKKMAERSDEEVLHLSCKERLDSYVAAAISRAAAEQQQFAPDLGTMLKWSVEFGWRTN